MDYKNSRIYKIVIDEDEYIGSTSQSLAKRFYTHKAKAIANKEQSKLYKKMREVGADSNHCRILLIELFPCTTKEELRSREDHWITERNPSLNTRGAIYHPEKAIITAKTYRDVNHDKIMLYNKTHHERDKAQRKIYREQHKESEAAYKLKYRQEHSESLAESGKIYYEANKDKIAEKYSMKVRCEVCNCEVRRDRLSKHNKTQQHMAWVKV
jgi:hypothetical protein